MQAANPQLLPAGHEPNLVSGLNGSGPNCTGDDGTSPLESEAAVNRHPEPAAHRLLWPTGGFFEQALFQLVNPSSLNRRHLKDVNSHQRSACQGLLDLRLDLA